MLTDLHYTTTEPLGIFAVLAQVNKLCIFMQGLAGATGLIIFSSSLINLGSLRKLTIQKTLPIVIFMQR